MQRGRGQQSCATQLSAARACNGQAFLFPVDARTVCREIGLNWLAASELFTRGLLSFDPSARPTLDDAQDAELRFLGGLVVAGCDGEMIEFLVEGLERPYAYRPHLVSYNFSAQRWVLTKLDGSREDWLRDWLADLVENEDHASLSRIRALVQRAAKEARKSATAGRVVPD